MKKINPFFVFASAFAFSLLSCNNNDDDSNTEVIPTPVVEAPTPITGKTYYVDASIAASGTGLTEATAFKTLAEAALATAPGDGVLVKNGTYSNFEETTSGTAAGWVVWRNFPGHKPKIVFSSWQGIYIKGSYVEIDGLTVQGNNDNVTLDEAKNQPGGCVTTGSPLSKFNGNGIYIDGRTSVSNNPTGAKFHHINVKNCTVYDCGGPGVGVIQADYIRVENCTIFDNSWYSIYGTSGISLYQIYNSDTNADVKNIIRGNTIYNNKMLVPWKDGGCKFTDGNGIIIDDSKNTQNASTLGEYVGKTLIENNVVYNNGGRGIHVFVSDNVTIVNNTTYQNCSTPEINDGEITVIGKSSTVLNKNCSVYNNIVYARTGKDKRVNTTSNTENFFQRNNIYFNSILGSDLPTFGGSVDPFFVSVTAGSEDFRVKAESKTIDWGYSKIYIPSFDRAGEVRFKGANVDCGAYENR